MLATDLQVCINLLTTCIHTRKKFCNENNSRLKFNISICDIQQKWKTGEDYNFLVFSSLKALNISMDIL